MASLKSLQFTERTCTDVITTGLHIFKYITDFFHYRWGLFATWRRYRV